MKTKIFHLAVMLVFLAGTNIVFAQQSEVYIIQVADAISPGTADFIKSGIKTAEKNGAACVIIELDPPGVSSSMITQAAPFSSAVLMPEFIKSAVPGLMASATWMM
jgi:membrane-bound ClpP family serine protease